MLHHAAFEPLNIYFAMYLISKVFHELCFVVKKMVPLANFTLELFVVFYIKIQKYFFPNVNPHVNPNQPLLTQYPVT